MQATTGFHDGIPKAILQEADGVLHHPVAFHPTNGVLNADADGGHTTIRGFLRRGEVPAPRCFLGLHDGDVLKRESLAALILIQTTARWQGIARQLRQALLRRLAFTGVAQAVNMTGLIDHEAVVERVPLLLATVIFLWRFGIGRAVDGPFSPIMPTRGGWISGPARASRPSAQTRRLCGLAAVRGRLRPDSTRDAGRESMCSHALDSSPRAVLAPLAWDAVSRRSG